MLRKCASRTIIKFKEVHMQDNSEFVECADGLDVEDLSFKWVGSAQVGPWFRKD